jgi:TnpA family transposase
MKKERDRRLSLAIESDINEIYGYPIFSANERQYYFALSEDVLAIMETLKTYENKMYFILSLGYFKYKTIFFKIDFAKSSQDIAYINKHVLIVDINCFIGKIPSKNTITKIKQLIYKLLNIESDVKQKQLISEKLNSLAKYNINPVDMFHGLLSYMQDNNISIPAYTTLQTLTGEIIAKEEKRLYAVINRHFPKYALKIAINLLAIKDGFYPISSLKTDPKNFRKGELKKELDKHIKYSKLFIACEKIIPKLGISKNNLTYYSSLAAYYSAFRLEKFPRNKSILYIICFVHFQFHKINNNLIEGFMHYIMQYEREEEEYAKKEICDMKMEIDEHQPLIIKILTLFNNQSLNNWKFKEVKKKAFEFVSENVFKKIIRLIKRSPIDKKELIWEYHEINHQNTATNLRPLFMAIDFDYTDIANNLKQAAVFMKAAFAAKKSLGNFQLADFPQDFIKKELLEYLLIEKFVKGNKKKTYRTINPYKYEYLVYQQIGAGIHSGAVHSNVSVGYKHLDVDLGLDNNFEKQKKLIQKAYMPALTDDIITRLNEHKELLEALLISVNQRISSGENKHVKIKKQGETVTWTLPYKKIKPDFNNPFYDKLPQIKITDLLAFVDALCNFTSAFSHIKTHGSSNIVDYEYILACILADATGMGIYKMSESSNLNYNKLSTIHNSRIRLETLVEANNILIAALEKLPIFEYYNINDALHGAPDGLKADVKLQTFKSRYLRKYFKEKGVSSYTMVVNNIAISSRIINSHESHFLFDILHNNTSSVRPTIISTDTEGSNNLNDALLELIKVLFAPHYKSIARKAKTIGTFSELKQYKDCIIKPHHRFKENLIIEEWPNIQKIYVALLAGDQTQSTIVKKLSSHQRKDRTKDALWEYNSILRSIYLLWYIDDATLRRSVRTALNRTEGYHQLERALVNVGGGKLRGKSDIELSIWNECTRLVANAIIYYNSYLLSQFLVNKGHNLSKEEKNLLKRISPIAWQHILFSGNYDFSFTNRVNIRDIMAIIKKCFEDELSKTKKK